jgi:hypothetical protein
LTLKLFWKLARPDGWDFYTGNTINYRECIGKTVTVGNNLPPELCSKSVLHASKNVNDAFVGARIPCSAYRVRGKPLIRDEQKCGFKELFIIEEIAEDKLDELFGWRYSEACNPINPFKINPSNIGQDQMLLLKNWDSVRDLARDSVGDSVWASVGDSVRDLARVSVGDSVWASVGDSVGDSVRASVWAYIGSLFPKVKKWKYVKHKRGKYPFQSTVDLWKQGLVPSFDGTKWRLHGRKNGTVLFEITESKFKGLED